MWTIYKITNNINGKSYIGQTSQKVEDRWNEHKRGKTSKNSPLKRAIKKYGWDNTFDSFNEVSNEYFNINKNQILNVLNHKMASTHQLIFLYEEDKDRLSEHLIRANKAHKGKIKSINLETGEENIYQTITEAEKQTGICRQTIRNRIRKNIIKDNIKWFDL